MNILFRNSAHTSALTDEIAIPQSIAFGMRTVTQHDLNRTANELDLISAAPRAVYLGRCPEKVRQLAAYSRRLFAKNPDDPQLQEIVRLATRICEKEFAYAIAERGKGKFRIMRQWHIYLLLE